MNAMRNLGVPYTDDEVDNAIEHAMAQAEDIAKDLQASDLEVDGSKEIIAMIAYLQRLGTDIKAKPIAETTEETNNQ